MSRALLFCLGSALASTGVTYAYPDDTLEIAYAGGTDGDGQAVINGIEMLLASVNEAGGVGGREITLRVFDDGNDSGTARQRATEIADDDGVLAVVGHYYSSCSISGGEVYRRRGVPAVTPASTNIGVTRDNDWYFRVIHDDEFQGRFLAHYAARILGWDSVTIVHEDLPYGAGLAAIFEEASGRLGMTVRNSWGFRVGSPRLDESLRTIVERIRGDEKPGPILLAAHLPEGIRLVSLIREAGIEAPIIAPDAFSKDTFPRAFASFPRERAESGFYTDGIYTSSPLLFDVASERVGRFSAEYVARFGESPGWPSVYGHDAARTILNAIEHTNIAAAPGSLAADRRKIRDHLAGLRDPADAVEGIVGPIYFDGNGDAPRPISMAVYRNNQAVTALTQLQMLYPHHGDSSSREPEFDSERLVVVDEKRLYRTEVVYTGIRPVQITGLDEGSATFNLDFHLWFTYHDRFKAEDIVFENAVEPVLLSDPVAETTRGGMAYRAYRAKGVFKADFVHAPYGEHFLGVRFRHRHLTRNNLVYATDLVGMSPEFAPRGGEGVLNELYGWRIYRGSVFQDVVSEHTLGHPDYVDDSAPGFEFSRFNAGVFIRKSSFSLRGLVDAERASALLAAGLVASILFAAAWRAPPFQRFAKSLWVVQTVALLTVLITAETVLGNWLSDRAGAFQMGIFTRVFDILWWLVPAFLVSVAIHRFVWRPLERRSGQSIPTILKRFVATAIYFLAIIGIVGFVFDQKLTSLLATSGIIAMIIGLAVQINISNIFSGIALNLERPFRIGDWIMVHGRRPFPEESVIGRVVDINWRATRLETTANCVVVIPNSVIAEKTVTNFMKPDEVSRFELLFYADYTFDTERVVGEMRKALDEVSGTPEGPLADPAAKVRVNGTTAMGVEYEVRYYIVPRHVSPAKARNTVVRSVLDRLRREGITLAYPAQRVYYEQMPPGFPEGREIE